MKAQLTLKRAQLVQFAAFLISHPKCTPFMAKDQGAYVGASNGPDDKCIFYFRGCDPDKDDDWYDTAHRIFGGDDFGDHFDRDTVLKAADNPQVDVLRFVVTSTQMRIEGLSLPKKKART